MATKVGAVLVLLSAGCAVELNGTGEAEIGSTSGRAQEGAAQDLADPKGTTPNVAQPEPGSEDGSPALDTEIQDPVRLNHLQIKGSVDSYHVAPAFGFDMMRAFTQAPLDVQLEEQNVRALDLDLQETGPNVEDLQVYTGVFDDASTCKRFVDCLSTVKAWSLAHRSHAPIVITISLPDVNAFKDPTRIDAAIRQVFADTQLITPDFVRGKEATLRDAIAERGWPSLEDCRGRVMFVLNDEARRAAYVGTTKNLETRAMFVADAADEAKDFSAVSVVSDPMDATTMQNALNRGRFVLTQTCVPGASNDTCNQQRAAAVLYGAHVLSDVYPVAATDHSALELGQGVRCNRKVAKPNCDDTTLEPEGGHGRGEVR